MADLDVWVNQKRVGLLSARLLADGGHEYRFRYERATRDEDLVSLTMIPSVGGLEYVTRSFPPPFDMVLPEGERRNRIEAARKIVHTDPMSLLALVGRNPINRVRFVTADESPDTPPLHMPAPAEILGSHDGMALFRKLVAELDEQQGIAGVQPKLLGRPGESGDKPSLHLRNFRSSTHILKACSESYPFLATNEFLTLGAAAKAGLVIPEVSLNEDGQLLLVKRFDLDTTQQPIGFEEAAPLMGETSDTKYRRDYGSMIDYIADAVAPQSYYEVRRALFKALVLDWLGGNGDAHLKNFGVTYTSPTNAALAPIYDCVCTRAYVPDDIPALALSEDFYSKRWWPKQRVAEFGTRYGALDGTEVDAVFDEVAQALRETIPEIRAHSRDKPAFAAIGDRMIQVWVEQLQMLG